MFSQQQKQVQSQKINENENILLVSYEESRLRIQVY